LSKIQKSPALERGKKHERRGRLQRNEGRAIKKPRKGGPIEREFKSQPEKIQNLGHGGKSPYDQKREPTGNASGQHREINQMAEKAVGSSCAEITNT